MREKSYRRRRQERERERGREGKKTSAKIRHINDDGVDVKQGCGLLTSNEPVRDLCASSISIDIEISNPKENVDV